MFSQWLRMHELVQRQLHAHRWEHVLFHGEVPSHKRGELIDQFRRDERCRVFLSTDAGGLGLNLQHASVVVNLDLPWNPAILEQRIGRVHRLGQTRPVHVLNFVSEGSIEHGILGLLKFKRSVFAGALDGGESEVFLGGSRLNRFMDTVQNATGNIPVPAAPQEPEVARESVQEAPAADRLPVSPAQGVPAHPPQASDGQRLLELLKAGRSLLDTFVQSLSNPSASGQPSPAMRVERDPATGENYMRLPLPSPEKLRTIIDTVAKLLTQ